MSSAYVHMSIDNGEVSDFNNELDVEEKLPEHEVIDGSECEKVILIITMVKLVICTVKN